jgi:CRISPR/Cas system-associated protein Csm6
MKVVVSLKDPDGFADSVNETVKREVSKLGLDHDEAAAVEEKRLDKAWKALGKFVQYGEYVTIEFDTDAGTATVVPR